MDASFDVIGETSAVDVSDAVVFLLSSISDEYLLDIDYMDNNTLLKPNVACRGIGLLHGWLEYDRESGGSSCQTDASIAEGRIRGNCA